MDVSKRVLTVPNVLSLFRLVGVPLLYPLAYRDDPTLFLLWFILLGLTDFIDGKLARAWNQTTVLGSFLDSIADLAYYLSAAYFMIVLFPHFITPNMPFLIGFFIILAGSMVIPFVKFGKVIFLHTNLTRLNGVLVFLLVCGSFLFDTTLMITGILGIYYIAYFEIYLIFLKYGEVDRDTRSIFMANAARNNRTADSVKPAT